jgi:hypothetical protein
MQELLRLREEGNLDNIQLQWFRRSKPEDELFDCKSDPHELNNLANHPAYQEKLKELQNEMNHWLLAIKDQPNLPEQALINRLWNNNKKQPVTAPPSVKTINGKIKIDCTTEGASIGYKIIKGQDTPPKSWFIYTKPFKVPQDKNLLIKAHRIGYKASKMVKVSIADLE